MTITCSTKVCSFGKQVVEKVETEYARFENGRFVYRIHRSPMCEYMINFIHKLKHLPEKYMMNSVLENFTILQVCRPHRVHLSQRRSLSSPCFSLSLKKRRRWWRIGTRKRRFSAWPTFSKCPRRNTEPNTTSTGWWKIDVPKWLMEARKKMRGKTEPFYYYQTHPDRPCRGLCRQWKFYREEEKNKETQKKLKLINIATVWYAMAARFGDPGHLWFIYINIFFRTIAAIIVFVVFFSMLL